MNTILHIILGWITLLILLYLCLPAIFNKAKTMKGHKTLGILLIIVMLAHGKLGGQKPDIFAMIACVLAILMPFSFMFAKKFPKGFRQVHRVLAFLLLASAIIHILISMF